MEAGASAEILSGPWLGLSAHLLAHLWPCNENGVPTPNEMAVIGPISDHNLDLTFNWQSPFENAGPESKFPAMMAMVQSGQLATLGVTIETAIETLQQKVKTEIAEPQRVQLAADMMKNVVKSVQKTAEGMAGRTGITKLNSRQVFSGMPPAKINFTLHFRTLHDPARDIVAPYKRLLSWALPVKLSQRSVLNSAIAGASQAGGLGAAASAVLDAMFPSTAPTFVMLTYAGQSWGPMVIEHFSHPLDSELDRNGQPLRRAVQLSLGSLTAIDRSDITSIFKRG